MRGELEGMAESGSFDWLLPLALFQAALVMVILVSGEGATWALAAL